MKKMILMIVCALVLVGGGFWGGMTYQKQKTTSNTVGTRDGAPPSGTSGGRGTFPSGSTPPSGGQGGPGGGNGASGEIISISDNSVTIKTSDGSTKIIYFTSSTKISKNTAGSTADLTVGTTIMANGTTNTDKSIASTTIMIQNEDQQ